MATFKNCVKRIHGWNQDFFHVQKEITVKAWYIMNPHAGEDDTRKGKILSIPLFILHKVKPANIKRDLIKWHSIYNSEGRIIHQEKATAAWDSKEEDSKEESKSGTPSTKKGKQKHAWCTKALVMGTKEASLQVLVKDDND